MSNTTEPPTIKVEGTPAGQADPHSDTGLNGHGPHPLRAALESLGGSMKEWTVLAPQHDPFRLDVPSRHRDGQWLADRIAALRLSMPRHLRGLHYLLLGQPKPDGKQYTNTDQDWAWLQNKAAKAARWLGYLPFDAIIDQRNDEPEIIEWSRPDPHAYVNLDFRIYLPDEEDLSPRVGLDGFGAAQPYHLVLVGEKSSLRPVLSDVARRFQADLYLPTGEISDTQAHRMVTSSDRRPLRVFYFADADPAGWQMPVSLIRKLQGLKTIGLAPDYQVHPVALNPDQVRQYGLPETPLKEGEKRADDWYDAYGVMQTEIDALTALRPDLLRQIATDAISPFFDETLEARVDLAKQEWLADAQEAVDDQDGGLDGLRDDALERLADMEDEVQAILDNVRIDADDFDLPAIPDPPQPVIDEAAQPKPLCDSAWDLAEQCRRLKAWKRYDDEGS
jgi:hypothetical protein